MTREEAKQRLDTWLICRSCPADKVCYNAKTGATCEHADIRDKFSLVDALHILTNEQTGVWVDVDGDNATCSNCNRYNFVYGSYCKHCGIKMATRGCNK